MSTKSYSYGKSYGVYTENVEAHDAYIDLYRESQSMEEDETIAAMASEAEPISSKDAYNMLNQQSSSGTTDNQDALESLTHGLDSLDPLQPTTLPKSASAGLAVATTTMAEPTTRKGWKELLNENKNTILVAACAIVLGWFFFSND